MLCAARSTTRLRFPTSKDPLSAVSTAERSSFRSTTPRAKRSRILPRPSGPSAAHPGKAARAAFTARSTSEAPPADTSPSTVPSMGENTEKVFGPAAAGSPPTQWHVSTPTPATRIRDVTRCSSPRRPRNVDDDVAEEVGRLHPSEGVADAFEGVHGVDDGPEIGRVHESQHLQRVRARARGRPDDRDLLIEDAWKVDGDVRPRRGPGRDDTSARPNRSHAVLPRRRADRVDDDVHRLIEALAGGDGLVSADVEGALAFRRGPAR